MEQHIGFLHSIGVRGSMRQVVLSSALGKIAAEVLLRETYISRKHDDYMKWNKPLVKEAKNQSLTDAWLQEAIRDPKRKDTYNSKVVLSLPIVLRTLQRLRSNDSISMYFALMSRIKCSDIKWFSTNGYTVTASNHMPLEFFHELSTMLNRMFAAKQTPLDIDTITKFTFEFMSRYDFLMKSKSISNLRQTTKFYKNCIFLTTKSGSISHLLETLKRIPEKRQGLKVLAELTFYQQSSQTFRAFNFLEQKIMGPDAIHLDEEEVADFFPVFFSLMLSSISKGGENICCSLLKKLSADWKYEMSTHDYTILRELSERTAAIEVLITLQQCYPSYSSVLMPWKTFESQLDWKRFIDGLYDVKIDLFSQEQDLDFLQFKLSSIGPKIQDWVTFLNKEIMPIDANESLKAFSLHSVLLYLGANKNLGFLVSILEHMIYEMNLAEVFLNTHKLLGQAKCSNFHVLFKAMSNSGSSVLSANFLFNFLLHERQLPFEFNANDFYYMMKSCLSGANYPAIYHFLYHCIRKLGATFYRTEGKELIWCLPPQIESLIRDNLALIRGDNRSLKIIKKLENWFTQQSSVKDSNIDTDTLKDIFGDAYFPKLDINVLQSWKKVEESSVSNTHQGFSVYSTSSDIAMSERLRNLTRYMLDRKQPM